MSTLRPIAVKRNKQFTVYLEYSNSQKRKRFNTNVHFDLDLIKHYNKDANLNPLKRGIPDYKDHNDRINSLYAKIQETIDEFTVPPEIEVLDKRFKEKIGEEKEKYGQAQNILDYSDQWVKIEFDSKNRKRITHGTIKHRKLAINRLKEVKDPISPEEVDNNLYEEIRDYCYDVKVFSANHFGNIVKNLKVFFGYLIDSGVDLPNYNPQKWYRVTKPSKSPLYLLSKELEYIISYDKPLSERLEKTKDRLVFQCLTGLRFGDMMRIGKKDFMEPGYLKIASQEKTKRPFQLPLRKEALEILKKYDFKIPKISNVKHNEYIKDLLVELELFREYEKITHPADREVREVRRICDDFSSHNCVHTFITLAVSKGVMPKTLEKIIGKDAKTIINHYYGQSVEDFQEDIGKILR